MSLVHVKWAIHATIVTNFKRTSQRNEACGAKWPQNTAWAIIQTWVRVEVSGMVCVKCLQTNLYGPLLSPGASSAIGRRLFHRRPPGISIKGPPKPSHPGKWVKNWKPTARQAQLQWLIGQWATKECLVSVPLVCGQYTHKCIVWVIPYGGYVSATRAWPKVKHRKQAHSRRME